MRFEYEITLYSAQRFESVCRFGWRSPARLAKLVTTEALQPPNGGGLIYAGSQAWQQSGTQIVGFERTAELLTACAADADAVLKR